MLAPGTLVAGRYRIESLVGGGGMGEVHRAEVVSTGRRIALKVLRADLVSVPGFTESFAREARLGASIPSAHVVEVLDAGVDAALSAPWLAMELLNGRTLQALLADKVPRPPEEVSRLFAQLGDAMGAAHEAGVIHLDLKPENVFLAEVKLRGLEGPVLKVLDFGIAKVLTASQTSTSLTTAVGSPTWMAPEQTEAGARVRFATDVWPMGLIAYRMLTGRLFWRSAGNRGANVRNLLAEVAVLPLPSALERATEQGVADLLPGDFGEWFSHCVHRDPTQRFQNGRAAAEALRSVLRAASEEPSPWGDELTTPDGLPARR